MFLFQSSPSCLWDDETKIELYVFIRDLSLIGLTGTPLKTKQWILTNVKMVLLEER